MPVNNLKADYPKSHNDKKEATSKLRYSIQSKRTLSSEVTRVTNIILNYQ